MSYVQNGWHTWDRYYQISFLNCMERSLSELDPNGEWLQWPLYQKWLPVTRPWVPPASEPLTKAEAYELAIALHQHLESLFVRF